MRLPEVGDDLFDLWIFNDVGNAFDTSIELMAGITFDFTSFGLPGGIEYSVGAAHFRILGIESDAMLDPNDTTAFDTTSTFASTGNFTGTMTPITVCVPESATLTLIGAGLAGIGYKRHHYKKPHKQQSKTTIIPL